MIDGNGVRDRDEAQDRGVLRFLANMPSTNLRIFVSVALAVVYVIGTMVAGFAGRPLDGTNVITLGSFLLAMMGLDVAQFAVKRNTFIPSPPGEPDVEDRLDG